MFQRSTGIIFLACGAYADRGCVKFIPVLLYRFNTEFIIRKNFTSKTSTASGLALLLLKKPNATFNRSIRLFSRIF